MRVGRLDMRMMFTWMMMAMALGAVAGCQQTDWNSPALQAMQNPPNACGPGGTSNINDCSSRR